MINLAEWEFTFVCDGGGFRVKSKGNGMRRIIVTDRLNDFGCIDLTQEEWAEFVEEFGNRYGRGWAGKPLGHRLVDREMIDDTPQD